MTPLRTAVRPAGRGGTAAGEEDEGADEGDDAGGAATCARGEPHSVTSPGTPVSSFGCTVSVPLALRPELVSLRDAAALSSAPRLISGASLVPVMVIETV